MKPGCAFAAIFVVLALVLLAASVYVIDPTEQVIVTSFGKPVGEPVTEPGIHFKQPFIQQINRLPKLVMEWDGLPVRVPTKDKTYIDVDTFARWRIAKPLEFFQRVRNERSAQSRLDDIIGSEARSAIAKHNLIEIVRTDKNREPVRDEALAKAASGATGGSYGTLPKIQYGRRLLEQEVLQAAAPKVAQLGIELRDMRVKRVNYDEQVLDKIYQRMKSERQQIAQRFRSEGEGEAAKIKGQKERDMNEIESTAYKQVQEIKGEADAKASQIYAEAYTQKPEAAEFYQFMKNLDTLKKTMAADSTVILSTESEIFQLLKQARSTKNVGQPTP